MVQINQLTHQEENQQPIHPLDIPPETNQILANIFLQNSPDITSNEMNQDSFLEFCRQYLLCQPHCSLNDCKTLFQATISLGKVNQSVNELIVFDKRIQYIAFRDVLLPLLANKKGVKVEDLVEDLVFRSNFLRTQSLQTFPVPTPAS